MSVFASIRTRFTAWYLVVLAILLVAMSLGIYAVMHHTLIASLDEMLSRRLDEVQQQPNLLGVLTDDRHQAPLGEINGLYVLSDQGWEARGRRLSDASIALSAIEAAAAEEEIYVTIEHEDGQEIRYLLASYAPQPPSGDAPEAQPWMPSPPLTMQPSSSLDPISAVLVVGRPTADLLSALSALRITLLFAVPLTLLLSGTGGLFLIRRALRPVDQIIAATHRIEETDLSRRVPVQSNDELGRLARTLNSMLARLERAFARQRQFTDDASHELRTPLSVIEAEATLALMRERENHEYREALATIAEESSSMHKLINQLLTLARGDSLDRENLETEIIDLGTVVSEVTSALEPLAKERGVDLDAETSPIRIDGDPVRIRRLVVNLLDNAIRYTEQGGSVSASLAAEGVTAVFRVQDTGIGIAPEHQELIFERFARLDSSRSRGSESSGSGLGLSICKQIVELHGGSIEIESAPQQGSTFTIRLPLADRAVTPMET